MSGNAEETKTPAVDREGETKQGGAESSAQQKKGDQQRKKSVSKNGDSQSDETGDSNVNSSAAGGDSSKSSSETWAGVAAGGSNGTKVPVTGGEASAQGSGGTKVPITGGENDTKHTEEKKSAASSSSGSHDEDSVPVTFHTEEKQQKKSRQPTKKERAESIKQQANKEFAAKKFATAIQLYNEALELDASNHVLYSNRATARYNLAQEIANQGEHPDAQQHCAIHSEVSPSWGAAMSLYYGGLEDALKAIELEPNYLKAYLRVGACLLALGKYQAAVQSYEAALTKFPNEESVKTALKEAREKASKLEEGFPLFHSFINLAGKQPAAKQAPPSDAAVNESAARLHRELFGKRNALVQTPKPETRWQFYFEQPPNRRSTSAWESDFQRRQREAEEGEDGSQYFEGGQEQEQYYRGSSSPHAYFQHQYQPHPPPPRFQQQRPSYQAHHQQQPSYQQQSHHHQQQSHYQQQQQQQQQSPYGQQPSYHHQQHQQHQQQSPYGQQPSYQQQHQQSAQPQYQANKKRPDTSIPNRKAAVGYLQELCENLRVSQYLPALLEQGVETVDDLMLLSPEAIRSVFPTLGHQARVLDWLSKAKGEL